MRNILYFLTTFAGAFLLFVIQPMVGRMLLPSFGGAPAVWNTCLVFFQSMLFLAYLYAHLLKRTSAANESDKTHQHRKFAMPVSCLLHTSLLWAGYLLLTRQNFYVDESAVQLASPAFSVFKILVGDFGLPILILGASAPLLQCWFAASSYCGGSAAYRLYVASNLGSFMALALYPTVIERQWDLSEQGRAYVWVFVVYGILLSLCALLVTFAPKSDQKNDPENDRNKANEIASHTNVSKTTLGILFAWGYLAFLPSALLTAVTAHLTNDVAPVPLLWIVPLALYLLSYIVAFSEQLDSHVWQAPLRTLSLCGVILVLPHVFTPLPGGRWIGLGLHLLAFFLIACTLHLYLYARRPEASRLTEFYLAISAGGLVGGIVGGLVPPLIFNSPAEYPLLLLLYVATLPMLNFSRLDSRRRPLRDFVYSGYFLLLLLLVFVLTHHLTALQAPAVRFLVYGCGAVFLVSWLRERLVAVAVGSMFIMAIAFIGSFYVGGDTLVQLRNFFGVKRVLFDRATNHNLLVHGRIVHGIQSRNAELSGEPLAYYGKDGPLGMAVKQVAGSEQTAGRLLKIGVIGLGAGSIGAYSDAASLIKFFEIDPEVEALAREKQYFTFLDSCGSRCQVVIGDGRLQLRREADAFFDLIVLDAFSSDSVPAHLLSREALDLYLQKLAPGGVLMINASNKFLRIDAVIAAIADDVGVPAYVNRETELPEVEKEKGRFPATWVFIPREANVSAPAEFVPLLNNLALPPWTDRYSNIFSVIRW